MAKFKVIALSVGGLRNRIFDVGDIVTDKNFKEGRAAELVKQKFLEEIPEDGSTETEKAETTPAGVEGAELNLDAETSGKPETTSTEGTGTTEEKTEVPGEKTSTDDKGQAVVEIPTIDQVTTTLLKNELEELKISFNKNASKKELYELWKVEKLKK